MASALAGPWLKPGPANRTRRPEGKAIMDVERVPEAFRHAFAADRVEATRHLWDELRADAFVLADVWSAVESIYRTVDMGTDRAGHPKFEVTGRAVDGRPLSIICAFKDETESVLLITAYEGD